MPASLRLLAADRPRAVLAVVCALYAVAPVVLVGPHFWFGWDESVYISQVSRYRPALLFTAPRARGMPLLVAPVAELTSSTAALRVYLAVLSAIGLYLAFRPWLRLLPGYTVPLAAVLFVTLWVSIFYGFEAMPNLYVAIGALAAAGHFLRARQEPERRRHLVWLAAWLAFTALMRPTDSLYLVIPLAVAAVTMRDISLRNRGVLLAVLIGGVAIGWAEWAVEAFVSYGGLAARIHAASAEVAPGLHAALGLQARTLAGSIACNPCTQPVVWSATAWWFAVPPAAALGIASAIRRRAAAVILLPTLCGLALLAEYTLTVDYAAPRYLLPTYALLSLACAEGFTFIYRVLTRSWSRRLWLAAASAAVVVQLASQLWILERHVMPPQTAGRQQALALSQAIRQHGVRQPCNVVGHLSATIPFGAYCSDVPTIGHPSLVMAKTRTADVAVVTSRRVAGRFYSTWPVYRLHGGHLRHSWYLYVRLRQ